MLKVLVFVLFLTYTAAVEQINKQIINRNVDRSIDLKSQLVKIFSTITIENAGKEPVSTYLVALEASAVGSLSYISAKDVVKDDLNVKSVEVKVDGVKATFYSIFLRQPLEPSRTTTIIVEQIFTNALSPYPSNIMQKEKQLVRYFGNHYFYSPYVTTKQKTDVILASRNIESYTKLKPVTQNDKVIAYGPYSTIQPFSEDQLIVHYENNSPFLKVARLERIIEVSHWGNIAVEEHIEIQHTGAKLKGSFSRYDYQRDSGNSHHSIRSYRTILPSSAHSIYYRDSNGNISTSSVKARTDWIELELRPRFPLFGGWQSSYTLGYSVPSYQYLFKKSNGEFVLSMRLLDHVFDDMFVDELETSIILPVRVSNVKIQTPYDVDRLPDEKIYKYLDYIGRTVVRFSKKNLVEQHIQDLEVSYNWQTVLLLHEPLLVTLALFILFIAVVIYVRLDFSISKPEHGKKE